MYIVFAFRTTCCPQLQFVLLSLLTVILCPHLKDVFCPHLQGDLLYTLSMSCCSNLQDVLLTSLKGCIVFSLTVFHAILTYKMSVVLPFRVLLSFIFCFKDVLLSEPTGFPVVLTFRMSTVIIYRVSCSPNLQDVLCPNIQRFLLSSLTGCLSSFIGVFCCLLLQS